MVLILRSISAYKGIIKAAKTEVVLVYFLKFDVANGFNWV